MKITTNRKLQAGKRYCINSYPTGVLQELEVVGDKIFVNDTPNRTDYFNEDGYEISHYSLEIEDSYLQFKELHSKYPPECFYPPEVYEIIGEEVNFTTPEIDITILPTEAGFSLDIDGKSMEYRIREHISKENLIQLKDFLIKLLN